MSEHDAIYYVDGSYDPKTGDYAYGIVKIGGFEQSEATALPKYYKRKFERDEMSSMNNVAGEIRGAAAVLQDAQIHGYQKIQLNYDYQGIEAWCTGAWKAKNPHTQAYQNLYREVSSQMQVDFNHTKAHSGIEFNEKCDELAKDALGLATSKDRMVANAGAILQAKDAFRQTNQQMTLDDFQKDLSDALNGKRNPGETGAVRQEAVSSAESKSDAHENFMKRLIEEKYGIQINGGDGVNYTMHYTGAGYKENTSERIEQYAKDRGAYWAWGSDGDGLNGDSFIVFDDASKVAPMQRAFCEQVQKRTDAQRASVAKAMSVGSQMMESDTQKEDDMELPWD